MSRPVDALRRRWGRPVTKVAHELSSGSAILDAGCGDGAWLTLVGRLRPDLLLVGADRSRPAQLPATVEFVQVNLEATTLPFDDGTFDLIRCAHVLEHLHQPVRLRGELAQARVCLADVDAEALSTDLRLFELSQIHLDSLEALNNHRAGDLKKALSRYEDFLRAGTAPDSPA